jgi:hypothetical protein
MDEDGPYTCMSCCCGTWNDSDLCDDCANICPMCGEPLGDEGEDSGYHDNC